MGSPSRVPSKKMLVFLGRGSFSVFPKERLPRTVNGAEWGGERGEERARGWLARDRRMRGVVTGRYLSPCLGTEVSSCVQGKTRRIIN